VLKILVLWLNACPASPPQNEDLQHAFSVTHTSIIYPNPKLHV
jgi:hypothetical protein